MASEWLECCLGDIASFKNGKGLKKDLYSPTGKNPVWGSNGQIARTNELLNEHPVIVIGRVGAYCGSVHAVTEPNWVTDNAILSMPLTGNDFRYLYYLMTSLQLERTAIGSAQPLLTQSGLKIISCRVAPEPEQKAIAHILGTLDDKIELNRKMNETLEAMAQALFKSWFIDFDPVRRNAARAQNQPSSPALLPKGEGGKSPLPMGEDLGEGSVEAFDRLFPDSFQPSELGPIPEGWDVKPLSKMVELIGGGTPKKSEPKFWGGSIPWYSVKDAPAEGDVFVLDTTDKITQEGLDGSSTKLLQEGVTIISARGTVGKLALVGNTMAMNQSCYGVKGLGSIGPCLNYFNLKRSLGVLRRNTHGAVFDTITRSTFDTVSMVQPNDAPALFFEEQVNPLL
ncbi:MAG: restriction endonuclease subunit S, partial [Desulfofustis sp.]|nr:restriction endonuclease subunit S [Desulfofustis sp.]